LNDKFPPWWWWSPLSVRPSVWSVVPLHFLYNVSSFFFFFFLFVPSHKYRPCRSFPPIRQTTVTGVDQLSTTGDKRLSVSLCDAPSRSCSLFIYHHVTVQFFRWAQKTNKQTNAFSLMEFLFLRVIRLLRFAHICRQVTSVVGGFFFLIYLYKCQTSLHCHPEGLYVDARIIIDQQNTLPCV